MLVKKETPLLDPISQFFSSFPTTSISLSSLNSLIRTLFSILSTIFFPQKKQSLCRTRMLKYYKLSSTDCILVFLERASCHIINPPTNSSLFIFWYTTTHPS
ncbi:hypothetical protein Pint_24354 [Pistacia integerrima]|uniref:Uncharacterized protein n=1 Tax=Pistacia integerrima TaxID=434235 RepID=A0ACC0YCQ8_9ROSI|nr:hypothetical protein Pint_24354 [Pistacia integerrima]